MKTKRLFLLAGLMASTVVGLHAATGFYNNTFGAGIFAATKWSPTSAPSAADNANRSGACVNWSNVVATPADDGITKTLNISPPAANHFYRLFKP